MCFCPPKTGNVFFFEDSENFRPFPGMTPRTPGVGDSGTGLLVCISCRTGSGLSGRGSGPPSGGIVTQSRPFVGVPSCCRRPSLRAVLSGARILQGPEEQRPQEGPRAHFFSPFLSTGGETEAPPGLAAATDRAIRPSTATAAPGPWGLCIRCLAQFSRCLAGSGRRRSQRVAGWDSSLGLSASPSSSVQTALPPTVTCDFYNRLAKGCLLLARSGKPRPRVKGNIQASLLHLDGGVWFLGSPLCAPGVGRLGSRGLQQARVGPRPRPLLESVSRCQEALPGRQWEQRPLLLVLLPASRSANQDPPAPTRSLGRGRLWDPFRGI